MNKRVVSSAVALVAMGLLGLTLTGQESKKAPDKFQAKFETTAGDFVIEVTREWSPNGADRFYSLVNSGLYDGCKFFRVIPGFMVQFGIHGDPEISKKWMDATIKDDPVMKSNKRGMVTYAKSGRPHSRTTQIFINFGNNQSLDSQGFAPFGTVIEGMNVVDKLYSQYGENKPQDQPMIQQQGNKYLEKAYPKLDSIKKATIVEAK